MVCLASRGPNSASLLRYGSRLAGRLNRNWYAVYVQTPSEDPTAIDAVTQRLLSDTLTLANQLGATVFTFKGQDVADTMLRFAREYRVGNIIMGRPRTLPKWKRILGRTSVAEQLIARSHGLTVIVVDAESEDRPSADAPPETPPLPAAVTANANGRSASLSSLLSPDRVVIWEYPVSKDEIFRTISKSLAPGDEANSQAIVQRLAAREKTGSTFLNEGVALPHARLEGLDRPRIALGLTHHGVLDAPTETPIGVVFMLVSPAAGPSGHLQLLAKAARLLQSRELRRRLATAHTPQAALDIVAAWEADASPPASSDLARTTKA